jgi:hypothetical protein
MLLETIKKNLTNNTKAKPFLFGYSAKDSDNMRNYYIIEDSRIFWVRSHNTPVLTTDLQYTEIKTLPANLTRNLKFL